MARQSLQGFLKYAKATLRSDIAAKRQITFVIGNESADLDSFTSSLLLAYIRSQSSAKGEQSSLSIPILNIPAADIQLRPEFRVLFRHANISDSNLVTLDDLPNDQDLATKLIPEKTQWLLVDHNRLQGKLGELYSSRVIGAIDHHEDENRVPVDTGKEPRIVQPCGSCTSLVVQFCRQAWDALSDSSQVDSTPSEALESETMQWDDELAKLALASILVDTTNLKAKEKAKEVDQNAVKYLMGKIKASKKGPGSFSGDALFDELTAAKSDLDNLSLRDILRKDYKQWIEKGGKLGISSVVKPLRYLSSKAASEQQEGDKKAELLTSLESFARERDLAMFAIMTTSTDEQGRFRRELLLKAFDNESSVAVKKFIDDSHGDLQLEEADILKLATQSNQKDDNQSLKTWHQRNLAASRKQVAPLLRRAMA